MRRSPPPRRARAQALAARAARPALFAAACAALGAGSEWAYRARLRSAERARADAGAFALFAIGGSTTVGSPFTAASFPRLTARALGDSLGGRPIALRNLARGGESIYPQALALRRALRARTPGLPAAVLIYSGHNEFMPARADAAALARLYSRGRNALSRHSLLAGDLLLALERRLNLRGARDLAHYERFLRLAVEESLAAGALPVLAVPAGNLSGVEPELYIGDDGRAAGLPLARAEALVERGRALERAGRAESALAYWSGLARAEPGLEPLARYRMGKCQAALGRRAPAAAQFRLAVALEPLATRARPAQGELVRRLAREYGVPLVDAEALFAGDAPEGVPGRGLFLDHVHPNPKGTLLLARAFAAAVAERLGARAAGELPDEDALLAWAGYSAEAAARGYVESGSTLLTHSAGRLRPDDRFSLARENFRRALALAPGSFSARLGLALAGAAERGALARKDEIGWWRAHGLLYAAEYCDAARGIDAILPRLAGHGTGAAELAALRALAPKTANGPFCRGGAAEAPAVDRPALAATQDLPPPTAPRADAVQDNLAAAERAAAAGRADEALRALSRVDARSARPDELARAANLCQGAGAPERALELIDRLLELSPGDAGLLLQRADAARAAGRAAEAREALDRVLALPADGGQRRRAADLFQALGEHARALPLLRALAAEQPEDAKLRHDAAVCEYLTGSPDAARAGLRRAIALDPGSPEPYLSLGAVHAAAGETARAAEVYARGLAAARPGSDPKLIAKLRAALLDARARKK